MASMGVLDLMGAVALLLWGLHIAAASRACSPAICGAYLGDIGL